MKLNQFDGQDKKELSMIEVAHAILSDKGESMSFVDIANEIQKYLGDSNREIRDRLPQFYTDLNVDGSFISLGNNVWGLRTWYPYDSIDEATISTEDEDEDEPRLKKRQKVNAFLADASDDDDVIDYENDDPEDQEGSFDVDEEDYHKDLDDDEENDDAEDTEIDDGVEGDLSEIDEDEVESENDDLSDDEEK